MKVNEYQQQALKTAMYPGRGEGYLDYLSKKLPGEVGELLEKLGKRQRKDGTMTLNQAQFTEKERQDLVMELGDIKWYVSAFLDELGFSEERCAQMNLDKLADRKDRGVIDGAGDHR